jgi:ribosomal protein S27E
VRWILVLFGVACLALLVIFVARRPAARRTGSAERLGGWRRPAARELDLNCSYCQSRRIVLNPSQGVYRCAHCGFRGTLPPAFLLEHANMHNDGALEGAGEGERHGT